MANKKNFPTIKPSSRTFTAGRYPQTEFVAQNGAKTVLRYGNKQVDAKLTLGFTNLTDSEVNEILNTYEEVNSDYDYLEFHGGDALAGITFPVPDTDDSVLFDKVRVSDGTGKLLLRYRFDGPPTVTSVRPNRSNVQCKFVACLDGD
tara:strand:- start:1304 stop:1744 length:441 start_codon:yes stop_codon:yes gene_type:complete